jgi:hypothetical protein
VYKSLLDKSKTRAQRERDRGRKQKIIKGGNMKKIKRTGKTKFG